MEYTCPSRSPEVSEERFLLSLLVFGQAKIVRVRVDMKIKVIIRVLKRKKEQRKGIAFFWPFFPLFLVEVFLLFSLHEA
jgi:hypothetical protein